MDNCGHARCNPDSFRSVLCSPCPFITPRSWGTALRGGIPPRAPTSPAAPALPAPPSTFLGRKPVARDCRIKARAQCRAAGSICCPGRGAAYPRNAGAGSAVLRSPLPWGAGCLRQAAALLQLGTAGLPGTLLRAELAPALLLDQEAALQTADVKAIEVFLWARVVRLVTNSPRHAALGGL